jgi:hypothetical protein
MNVKDAIKILREISAQHGDTVPLVAQDICLGDNAEVQSITAEENDEVGGTAVVICFDYNE